MLAKKSSSIPSNLLKRRFISSSAQNRLIKNNTFQTSFLNNFAFKSKFQLTSKNSTQNSILTNWKPFSQVSSFLNSSKLTGHSFTRNFSSTEKSKYVINIEDENHFQEVLTENPNVIVDFKANWCGPCKVLGPRLEEEVKKKNGKVILAVVDIDVMSEFAVEKGISSVPTVMRFENGKFADKFIGNVPQFELDRFFSKIK